MKTLLVSILLISASAFAEDTKVERWNEMYTKGEISQAEFSLLLNNKKVLEDMQAGIHKTDTEKTESAEEKLSRWAKLYADGAITKSEHALLIRNEAILHPDKF